MRLFSAVFLSFFNYVSFVSGHGYVASITVDGKQYIGNTPYGGNNGKFSK